MTIQEETQKRLCWILALLLFLSIVTLSGIHGFLGTAFFSLVLLILFLLTALPFTRAIFGRGPLSVIFAFPSGFILHALLLAVSAKFFGINSAALTVYMVVAAATAVLLRKAGRPGDQVWETADTLWLFVWLIAAVAVVSFAFFNAGRMTAEGTAYRAYFNGDFFRNLAVTGSLSHKGIPPENPYVSGHTLSYYWFFHLFQAYWITIFPSYRPDFMLLQFSLVAVSIFVSSFFATIRRYVSSRNTFRLLLPLLLFGGSYKGIYVVSKIHEQNMPWNIFREWNVEGILRWDWNVPQVDMLYRAFLYAPYHLIALTVFFLLLIVWTSTNTRFQRILVTILLFSSVGFSFFIGGILVLFSSFVVLIQTVRRFRERGSELILSGLLGFAFLYLYLFVFQMVQYGPSSTPTRLGLDRNIAAHFVSYTLLNWGAILPLGVAGIIWHSAKTPIRILFPFLLICFVFIYCVEVVVPGVSDVSLKMGYIVFVLLLMLGAGFIDRILVHHPARQKWLVSGLIVLLIPAFVTWLMDATNSQDIRNTNFTTYVSREDTEVLKWMRKNLPGKAVVQNYSWGKGYLQEFVTEVPPLAERSVFLGDKNCSRIFQIPKALVDKRTRILWHLFNEESTARIYEACRLAGIDFIFLSSAANEPRYEMRQELVEPYFTMAHHNGEALLFRRNEGVQIRPEDLEEKVLWEEDDRPVLQAVFVRNFSRPEIRSGIDIARWMSNDGEILLQATKNLQGNLAFNVAALGHDRRMEVYLNGRLLQQLTASPRAKKVSLPVRISEGDNRLRIYCPDGPERADIYVKNGDQRMLSVKVNRLQFTM